MSVLPPEIEADSPATERKIMLEVPIALDDVPESVFKTCEATTQDERDTISACVRTYARGCIEAALSAIEANQIFKDAWRYRFMVRHGVVPPAWLDIISEGGDGCRARADAAFDQFVADELVKGENGKT